MAATGEDAVAADTGRRDPRGDTTMTRQLRELGQQGFFAPLDAGFSALLARHSDAGLDAIAAFRADCAFRRNEARCPKV